MSLFDLTGRVIVVTGARGFLGRPICAALADAGARVVGLDLDPPSPNGSPYYHCTDVTSLESLRSRRDFILDAWGGIDGLMLLHGIDAKPGEHSTDPWRDWQAMLDVNLTGTANACRVFCETMAESRSGSVVTIGSMYASLAPDDRMYAEGFTKPAAYGASKSAVVGLTRYLAALWAWSGVRVNCLSPGGIGSDSTPADFRERFTERVPLGRMGTPGDLVGAVQFLLSDASAYITGQELRVDGGVGIIP